MKKNNEHNEEYKVENYDIENFKKRRKLNNIIIHDKSVIYDKRTNDKIKDFKKSQVNIFIQEICSGPLSF